MEAFGVARSEGLWHFSDMDTVMQSLPTLDVFGVLQKNLEGQLDSLADQFHNAIYSANSMIPALTGWENNHLLDSPSPEDLATHKQIVQRLLGFLNFAAQTTGPKSFIRRETAEMIEAGQFILEQKLAEWHGPRMSTQEADKILAACFPDEP